MVLMFVVVVVLVLEKYVPFDDYGDVPVNAVCG